MHHKEKRSATALPPPQLSESIAARAAAVARGSGGGSLLPRRRRLRLRLRHRHGRKSATSVVCGLWFAEMNAADPSMTAAGSLKAPLSLENQQSPIAV